MVWVMFEGLVYGLICLGVLCVFAVNSFCSCLFAGSVFYIQQFLEAESVALE